MHALHCTASSPRSCVFGVFSGTIPTAFTALTLLSEICLGSNEMRCRLGECENISWQASECSALVLAAEATSSYILAALVIAVFMVVFPTFCLGLAAIHASHCKDPACLHRHPGVIHPWIGFLTGIRVRKSRCRWCRCAFLSQLATRSMR